MTRLNELLEGASDLAAALVIGELLSAALEELIAAFLVDGRVRTGDRKEPAAEALVGEHKPLGTFSGRTRAAFALGLITEEEAEALYWIRKIRNRFAHAWEDMTFDDEEISKWGQKLIDLYEDRLRSESSGEVPRRTFDIGDPSKHVFIDCYGGVAATVEDDHPERRHFKLYGTDLLLALQGRVPRVTKEKRQVLGPSHA